ncbi:hypothetical protein AB5N19_06981 [Seiridium cardinale]
MQVIKAIVAIAMATGVAAMPHGANEAREPSLYVRVPESGCIKRSPDCAYTYIKREETETAVADDETFLKVREPGCIKRSPNCGYHYIKRSDIE